MGSRFTTLQDDPEIETFTGRPGGYVNMQQLRPENIRAKPVGVRGKEPVVATTVDDPETSLNREKHVVVRIREEAVMPTTKNKTVRILLASVCGNYSKISTKAATIRKGELDKAKAAEIDHNKGVQHQSGNV
ncbi:hypothetical protein V6N11_068180 [Hibiscus sabdariffa]|uniref:Uncharacterized protein n=1 Tax=Hibiscus sabdariffa TaxID=183260 RepID=A0ABR2STV9_9ROSI